MYLCTLCEVAIWSPHSLSLEYFLRSERLWSSKHLTLRGLDPSSGGHLHRHHNWSPVVSTHRLSLCPLSFLLERSMLSPTQQGMYLLFLHHAELHNCLCSSCSSFFESLITLNAGDKSAAIEPCWAT